MEGFKLIFSVLILAILPRFSLQFCVLRSNCTSDNSTCIPVILNYTDPNATAPEKWDVPEDLRGVCPDYQDVPNCCNINTMQILQSKRVSLDLAFGNPSTGCSICANNMKRFYCKYSCDPNQHLFITPGKSKYMNYTPGPGPDQDPIKVVASNISVDAAGACVYMNHARMSILSKLSVRWLATWGSSILCPLKV